MNHKSVWHDLAEKTSIGVVIAETKRHTADAEREIMDAEKVLAGAQAQLAQANATLAGGSRGEGDRDYFSSGGNPSR